MKRLKRWYYTLKLANATKRMIKNHRKSLTKCNVNFKLSKLIMEQYEPVERDNRIPGCYGGGSPSFVDWEAIENHNEKIFNEFSNHVPKGIDIESLKKKSSDESKYQLKKQSINEQLNSDGYKRNLGQLLKLIKRS